MCVCVCVCEHVSIAGVVVYLRCVALLQLLQARGEVVSALLSGAALQQSLLSERVRGSW